MPCPYRSPTALAVKIVNMSGIINCIEPVVSMTKTVIEMVILVAPPRFAAAPMMA